MSPNKILPGSPYTLSYFLTDHTDSATYYVRAVVYDATTGEVLDTQDLVRQTTNGRLFSKRAQSPGDPSGQGRKIIVVATAYTDAGYTTKADNYQEQSEVYVVQKELSLGGGGGGYGPDYGKIRQMMEEVVSKDRKTEAERAKTASQGIEKAPKIKFPDMPFEAVFGALGALQREVNRIPKDTVDLSGALSKLEELRQAVADKEVTPVTDMSPVFQALDSLESSFRDAAEELKGRVSEGFDALTAGLPDMLVKAVAQAISEAKFTLTIPSSTVDAKAEMPKPKEEPKKGPMPIDIIHLMKRS